MDTMEGPEGAFPQENHEASSSFADGPTIPSAPVTIPLKSAVDFESLRNEQTSTFEVDGDKLEDETAEQRKIEEEAHSSNNPWSKQYFSVLDGKSLSFLENPAGIGKEAEDHAANESPFDAISLKSEDITPDKSGFIKKMMLKPGAGKCVPPNARVYVHYSFWEEYNDEPTDSTMLREQCEKIDLGKGKFIEGMEIAILSMKKGEQSQFLLAPEVTFGELGCRPRIPANETMLMKIYVDRFEETPLPDQYDLEACEKTLTFEDAMKKAESERDSGNSYYNMGQQRYDMAARSYQRAANILEKISIPGVQEELLFKELSFKVYCNLAQVQCKLGRPLAAIKNARLATDNKRQHAKPYYWWAQALILKKLYREALAKLKIALGYKPNDADINSLLSEVDGKLKEETSLDKELYAKMFPKNGLKPDVSDPNKRKELLKHFVSATGADEHISDEELFAKLPEAFKTYMSKKLRDFSKEAGTDGELPIQQESLTREEVAYIVQLCMELDLNLKVNEVNAFTRTLSIKKGKMDDV